MSVINKMLRDLDKRGGLGPRNVEDGLRELNRAPTPEPSRPWGRIAIAIAALAVGGAAGWYVLQAVSRPPPNVAQAPAPKKAEPVAAPRPAAEAPKPVVDAPKPVAEAPKVVALAVEPPKVAAAPAKPAEPVTSLVGMAKSSVESTKRAAAASDAATAAALPAPKVARETPAAPVVVATAPPPVSPGISIKPAAPVVTGEPRMAIERSERGASGTTRAAAEYRSANDLLAQGQVEAALARYSDALRSDPRHVPARQSLVVLMLEQGRPAEAQTLLREGIGAVPSNTQWPMLLARLQVEGGDLASASQTLERSLAQAQGQGEYHAFLATVLQMQARHREAIPHYEASLRINPDSGRWLTGLAISLEEERRPSEAREAYRRALAAGGLGPQLEAFAERKLKQLQ